MVTRRMKETSHPKWLVLGDRRGEKKVTRIVWPDFLDAGYGFSNRDLLGFSSQETYLPIIPSVVFKVEAHQRM